jgi:hypothetical protein
MRAMPTTATAEWRFMGQGEVSPRPFGGTESELSLYRGETAALLRRYVRASVEVGRLPSVLGWEFFRSKGSSNTNRNFEGKRQTNRPVDRLTDASLPLCPTCWALGGQGPREHGRTHTCVPGLLLLLEDRSSIATPVVPLRRLCLQYGRSCRLHTKRPRNSCHRRLHGGACCRDAWRCS